MQDCSIIGQGFSQLKIEPHSDAHLPVAKSARRDEEGVEKRLSLLC
jgi:hypothetical protein